MVNQQLLDYIRQQLQFGVFREVINNNLIAKGWQQEDLTKAFNQLVVSKNSLNKEVGKKVKKDTTTKGKKEKRNIIKEFFDAKFLLFGKIKTEEDALRVISGVSNYLYSIAIAQAVLIGIAQILQGEVSSEVIYPLIDITIYAACAFFLKKFNSRTVVVILILISILVGISDIRNISFAIGIFWMGIRGGQATFKLSKWKNERI